MYAGRPDQRGESYGRKQKFGGMEMSEAQRLKTMENENRRLKLLVAEFSLHGEALKAAIRKTAGACPVSEGDVAFASAEYRLRERAVELPV